MRVFLLIWILVMVFGNSVYARAPGRGVLGDASTFPDPLLRLVGTYVANPDERLVLVGEAYAKSPLVLKEIQMGLINRFLPKFIELPEVTEEDVNHLIQAGIKTSIQPMKAFKAAETKTPIGLYKIVMGEYPPLSKCYRSINDLWRPFTTEEEQARYRKWDKNPMLPLGCTTAAMDVEFTKKLSELTGRNITIMTGPQNEYMRRGRELVDGKPTGPITTTAYFFGSVSIARKVQEHAMVSDFIPHGIKYEDVIEVDQAPAGRVIEDYQNTFGIKHPTGLAGERDSLGVVRGGAFHNPAFHAQSSNQVTGWGEVPFETISSRFAEALP